MNDFIYVVIHGSGKGIWINISNIKSIGEYLVNHSIITFIDGSTEMTRGVPETIMSLIDSNKKHNTESLSVLLQSANLKQRPF